MLFYKGKGVTKNVKEGVKWFHLAAKQGLPQAQFALAMCSECGEVIFQNNIEEHKVLEKTANNGYPKTIEILQNFNLH